MIGSALKKPDFCAAKNFVQVNISNPSKYVLQSTRVILGATETTIGPGISVFLNIYKYKILSTIGATPQATTETTAETSESTDQGINVSMYYLRFDCSGNWIPFATALASSFVITVLLIILVLVLVLRRRKRQKVKHTGCLRKNAL